MNRPTHRARDSAARLDAETRTQVDEGITRVFQLLGKRWNGPIMSVLITGPTYFADLRRAIPGISERMLSNRLTELAATELVVREVDKGPPLRVSYRLTEAGAALEPALKELAQWAKTRLPEPNRPTGC
ncbi:MULTISPECIES: helix-turn-helix domain-containing protein [Streptomyces]|uniref:winged helix-turn-helix transcriptional regulator n=1 Tax=Streptomyces TaxID=1883 RepID=UPI001162737B|nr:MULTISPECIES: helix-turn-helix domain-containing protein [Streptomyces]MCX4610534.1 helix-turn-helix transcriptional regulator [Streptomyces mirabilis]MCX5350752.1 helix-turn-helix transcriptional regulator [Streptomyces mirabilis]NMI59768.1 helix-turn-helix transcriptional regulator [Streptomyces sp. RLA2-12]QDN59010.1 helix-turn-helix transcriptional regulator [Streptomyces sp. S1D4-20]QDN69075.1 helix-turn-helix transcriptional regulator [Streptomyces sp. S1D4-14]